MNIDSSIIYNMRTKEGNKEADILSSAIRVFADYGYHNAKIHKIAEQAGVATGSVYVYYKNKETILLNIFEIVWERLYTRFYSITQRKEISAVEKLDTMIDMLFDMFNEDPSLAMVFVNEQNQLIQKHKDNFTPYYEKFLLLGEEVVKEGAREKLFNDKINVRIFRSFVFGGLRHLLHQWASTPQEYALDVIRKNVKYIVKNGLLTAQH